MDCLESLEILEASAAGAWDADPRLVEDARRHIADCDRCRSAWPERQAWQQKLTAAMQAVATPPGLSERLQANLPQPAAAVAGSPSRPRIDRRLWWFSAAALALVSAVALALAFWPVSPPIPLEKLAAAVDAPLESLPKFSGPFQPRLPHDWEPYFALDAKLVRGFPGRGPAQAGRIGLVPFQFSLRPGSGPLQGRLLMLKRSQLVAAELPREGFPHAGIRYIAGGAWIVWREGDWVFVCLMPAPRAPADLQQFQQTLTASRPLS